MAKSRIICPCCRASMWKENALVNRARVLGVPLYCNRTCAGLARRKHKTKAQKVAEKAAYDRQYRARNLERIKAAKREYFQRTYDPVKAAKVRKKKMARHVEYCRQPKYKAYKQKYDQQRRDSEYGPFAEAARLAILLNREIKQRASNYEIRSQNQTLNKRLARYRQETLRDRYPRA